MNNIGSEIFINVANFPIDGFNFPDITFMLETKPKLLSAIVNRMERFYLELRPDCIVCVESFGYIFGVPLALRLGSSIVLARKPSKLPRPTVSRSYSMCYKNDCTLEMHKDAIKPGRSVLIVDDFLATGGTAFAVAEMVRSVGGIVVAAHFVAEIENYDGRNRLRSIGIDVRSVFKIHFDLEKRFWKAIPDRITKI